MAVDVSNPHVNAVLTRAGLPPAPPRVLDQLHAACARADGYTDSVLEVSQTRPPDISPGGEALFVLMRTAVVLVTMRKRAMFKPLQPHPITVPLADFDNVAEDDDQGQHALVLLAPDPEQSLVFVFGSAGERTRMFRAVIAAHGGRFEQWGLPLDPANYAEDFDRYYAQIVAEGPAQQDGWHEWCEQQFGEFDIRNALGFAMEWRRCEIADAAGGRGPSSRVMRIGRPDPWIDAGPAAQRVVVRLGAHLYDNGLLGPPYDERTFDTGEPITLSDAGPARLAALITLAAHATAAGHPRAPEWTDAARAAIPAAPQSVLTPHLRALWSGIE